MPNRSTHRRNLKTKAHSIAHQATEQSIGETEKNLRSKDSAAAALGKRVGIKAGKARASTLITEQRKAIASEATKAR